MEPKKKPNEKVIHVPEDEKLPPAPKVESAPKVEVPSKKDLELLKFCKDHQIGEEQVREYISEHSISPKIIPEPIKKLNKKFPLEFETVNICDLIVILVCGISLLIATHDRYNDVVYTIVGGFMGYLGGGARGLLRHQMTESATTKKDDKQSERK